MNKNLLIILPILLIATIGLTYAYIPTPTIPAQLNIMPAVYQMYPSGLYSIRVRLTYSDWSGYAKPIVAAHICLHAADTWIGGTTDLNGYVYFAVKLSPGTYTAFAAYEGNNEYTSATDRLCFTIRTRGGWNWGQ